MTAADVLDKAADLIEQRGLNQDGTFFGKPRQFTDPDGQCRLCTLAAIALSAQIHIEEAVWCEAAEAMRHALTGDKSGYADLPVTKWSDSTPQPEVVATLRKVAADLRAGA